MKIRKNSRNILVVLILSVMIVSCAGKTSKIDKPIILKPIHIDGIHPAQVSEGDLRPGIDAFYYLNFFERHLLRLPKAEYSEYQAIRGKPIPYLNHQFGKDVVFDSGSKRGVGMRLNGFLHFSATGVYDLQALSNDGVIMYVANKLALDDPEQHSDRLSNIAHITIDIPGWYPIVIEYFQRKGTAALKLFWQVPGTTAFVPVPESAYGHKP